MKKDYDKLLQHKLRLDREAGQRKHKIIKFNAKNIMLKGFKDYTKEYEIS